MNNKASKEKMLLEKHESLQWKDLWLGEGRKCFKAIKNEVGRSQQKVIKLKVKEAIPNIDQSIGEVVVGPDDQRKEKKTDEGKERLKWINRLVNINMNERKKYAYWRKQRQQQQQN